MCIDFSLWEARRHLKTYFYSCSLNTVLCEAASLRTGCPSRSVSRIHVCFLTLFTPATPQTLSPHRLPGQCAHCEPWLTFSLMSVHEELCSPPPPFSLLPLLSSIPTPPFFLLPFPPILPLLLHSLETRSHVARLVWNSVELKMPLNSWSPCLHLPRTKIIGMSYCTWIIYLDLRYTLACCRAVCELPWFHMIFLP